MVDKIKTFFRKKKVDQRFMNAGKGYKLNEDNSNSETSAIIQAREEIKRAEPSEEAKIAGQAALTRIEAKKNDMRKFNTSYAKIQARVRKELEIEKKAKEALEEKDKTKSVDEATNSATNNEFACVSDVYFRCPYISDEVLTHKEWKKKIRDFLYEQLEQGEEAGLTSCLIIHNCNKGKEQIHNCVDTLTKYIDNILNNPDVEKYQKIRMSNRIFQEKVLPLEGALEFLQAAGFEKKQLLHNDIEEDFLVWNPNASNYDNLTILVEALTSAEVIPLELDRNLQILLPRQATKKVELPNSFYTLTLEELRREKELRAEAVERNQMLRTKAMRERADERELRKYRFTLIRIQFPDNIILQGTFSVYDKYRDVLDFVKENLFDPDIPFCLIMSIKQIIQENDYDKTLLDLKMVPTYLLKFHCKDDARKNTVQGYIKETVLCLIQDE